VAAVNAGIITVDEVRKIEDMNARGGKADELREPQNITGKPAVSDEGATEPETEPPPPKRNAPPQDAEGNAQAQAIAVESAARLLRKEIAAVQKMAVRAAADQDAFAASVTEFYAKHVVLVEQTLRMPRAEAESYCAGQAAQALDGWLAALETWKADDYAAGLAALALEPEAA
jgi:hypothetical protein